MSCATCAKVRAHLPAAIRARLEEVERRMEARRVNARIAIAYKVADAQRRQRQ
jgi:hypothetical protein